MKILSGLLLMAAIGLNAGFLGEDKYWRPRESMTFYLNDPQGGGFELKITVRDMNVYHQGERPVNAWVIAPDGKITTRLLIPDDGILYGDAKYRDGIFDIGCDMRYRDYHRYNSPGGYPPAKERSPFLSNPEKLPARTFNLKVPDNGKGIYRLALAASWDHWLSVTASRPLAAGIHPGLGAIYLHGDQLKESYLWIPENVKDVSIAVSEEIQPFNWSARLGDIATVPKTGFNYRIRKNATGGQAVKVETSGKTTGASLHIQGVPMILCSDTETAATFGQWQPPEVTTLRNWHAPPEFAKEMARIVRYNPSFTFSNQDLPTILDADKPFGTLRSAWWPLNDISMLEKFTANWAKLPENIREALALVCEQWGEAHLLMEQGLCTNQWTYDLAHLAGLARNTGIPRLKEVLIYNTQRLCRENSLGRISPDIDNYALRSATRYDWAADNGTIDNGIQAEIFGHDSEYGLESNMNMAKVWAFTQSPEIVESLKKYYALKTHLTLSKTGGIPPNTYAMTCSPTDSNSRTRFYTHKSPIDDIHKLIPYGRLWISEKDEKEWPFMEKGPFVRNFNNRYYFVNTGSYYAIFYGGPPSPVASNWTHLSTDGASMEFDGFGGMGYGGWNQPVKSGGLSAIWIPECGPALLANNHNIMYANALWGRLEKPLSAKSGPNADACMVADAFSDAQVEFNEKDRVFRRFGKIYGAPLRFERTVRINDHTLDVELAITAEADIKLQELNESIPIFADNRILTADGKVIEIPRAKVTPTHQPVCPGENPDMPRFKAAEIILKSAEGPGMAIKLDGPYQIRMAEVLRYRKEAAAMSGLTLELPKEWRQGETRRLTYQLKIGRF